MKPLVRRTLLFPETRVSSPKSPQCSIASCSPPTSPGQEILSDRDLHPPPKKKEKQKRKRKHWGPCFSDKPLPCSPSSSHCGKVLDEDHVDGPRRKRRKIRFFQNRFSKGDVVWAKAFPYTWWPGWIGRIEGSFAWLSFYGCKKSRRFRVSEICGFEEGYARLSKMAGVKLADVINVALEDLSRRTVIALTSCCWLSHVESTGATANHIAGVRERFDSRELLRFVNDLGVSACVADEETARVVRLSAQVYAYRSYASMCRHSEVAGDFSAADMLEFAREFAVSLFIDGVDDSVVSAVLDRFNEFGRFVSVCPRWMYQQIVELEEASPSGKEDSSDLSLESEIVFGGIVDPEDEFVDNILDIEFEITQQQELEVLEGPEVCMLNRADYRFFDMDEEYESVPNCLEVAVEQSNSTWKDISVDPTLELETSFTGMPLREVDFGTTCNKNIQSADDGSVFHENEQASVHLSCYKDDNLPGNVEDILNSSDIPLSREIVAYDNISLSNLESEKGEEKDDIAMNIEHEDDDSSAEQRFSVNFPADETVSFDKEIKFTGVQSSSDVCSVVQDGVPRGVIDNSSIIASPTKALSPNSMERWKDNLVNNFFKLHKSLVRYAEALTYAKVFVEYVTSTGYDTRSYDGSITGNNIDEKKALLAASSEHCSPSGANKSDKTNGFRSLTLPNCASSYKIRQKKHDKLISSGSLKWTRFYASPMMRERSKPTSRTKKSSSISRPPTSPKSLHMKFPKDFTIPSKEELEKKFRVFGRLDRSRTKLFFYTGAAQVVFLRNTDADAAYRHVKQKSIFDCANVRFWFDEHEKFRMKPSSNDHIISEKEVLSSVNSTPSHECVGIDQKEDNTKILCRGDGHKSTSPNMGHSPSNLKSCLKSPDARNGENSKKAGKVRFTIVT